MACYLCFIGGSKSWIPLLLPVFAVFASFSSGHGVLSISISLSILLILLSTLYSFTFSKQKQILVDNELSVEKTHMTTYSQKSHEAEKATIAPKEEEQEEEKSQGFLIKSQDLYSESESMDNFSSEEYHSSDVECWPYSMDQKFDLSDDSISDEESLIEIAIPSGHVSPEKDHMFNLKYCKLSKDFSLHKYSALDFLSDMNEEDNLIEIDIYMGSIKSSSYGIQTPL